MVRGCSRAFGSLIIGMCLCNCLDKFYQTWQTDTEEQDPAGVENQKP